jgi:hypothetical protein
MTLKTLSSHLRPDVKLPVITAEWSNFAKAGELKKAIKEVVIRNFFISPLLEYLNIL